MMEEKEPLIDVKAPEGTTVTVTLDDVPAEKKAETIEVLETPKGEEAPIPEEVLQRREELTKENAELERKIADLKRRIKSEETIAENRIKNEYQLAINSMNESAAMIGTSEGYVMDDFSERIKEINSLYSDLEFSLICLRARNGEE